MRLFGLYCDTIEELKKQGEDYLDCTTQFSLRDRDKFQRAVRVMAVFVLDDIRGREAVQFVLGYHQCMNDQMRRTGGQAELVEKITDLDRILDEGKWAFTQSTESGVALNGDLDNINRFTDLNFKMLGLVWNGVGELSLRPNNDTGLTAFGKEAIKRMEQVGMIVDCPYLDNAGFEDLLNIAERPFAASHSNVKAYCGHPGNLTGAQFKELVHRGGLCGPSLFSRFIGDDNNGSKGYLLRHICHMLELGREDVIAWGEDIGDEVTCDPGLSISCGMGRFANYLAEHGIGEAAVQKIFFDSAYRFFKKQIK